MYFCSILQPSKGENGYGRRKEAERHGVRYTFLQPVVGHWLTFSGERKKVPDL